MEANILDNINLVQLGEELQRARKRTGMTQEEAAKVIDVARTTLVAIEKGERRIKASELLKLARAYGRPYPISLERGSKWSPSMCSSGGHSFALKRTNWKLNPIYASSRSFVATI